MKKSAECSTKPRPQIGKLDVGGGLIDHDAHRALGRVRAHIDQAAVETLVAHRRHGDQHLAIEIASLRPAALFGGRFHGHESTPFPDSWESKLVRAPKVPITANSVACHTRCH
jgi:hypothetical protein